MSTTLQLSRRDWLKVGAGALVVSFALGRSPLEALAEGAPAVKPLALAAVDSYLEFKAAGSAKSSRARSRPRHGHQDGDGADRRRKARPGAQQGFDRALRKGM